MVHEALTVESLPDVELAQQVDRVLLEQARAHAVLYIIPASAFEHDRVDPGAFEQERQHQARGPGSDDADLRSRHETASASPYVRAIFP